MFILQFLNFLIVSGPMEDAHRGKFSCIWIFLSIGCLRIFRGLFHGERAEEIEVIIERCKNWYFRLHTALKLNNMTRKRFSVNSVEGQDFSDPGRLRGRPLEVL
jgi:hypothetical protein